VPRCVRGQDALDNGAVLLHVVPEEPGGVLVLHFAVVAVRLRVKPDVDLRGIELGASRKLSTLRIDDCMTAVPMTPGEVPMMPVGLRAKELVSQGRIPSR
jgi:hypothetical protein